MTKMILIDYCEQCPHSIFDRSSNKDFGGKWICRHGDILPKALTEDAWQFDDHVSIPDWCPLEHSLDAVKGNVLDMSEL